jgi:hypothetical protein
MLVVYPKTFKWDDADLFYLNQGPKFECGLWKKKNVSCVILQIYEYPCFEILIFNYSGFSYNIYGVCFGNDLLFLIIFFILNLVIFDTTSVYN